MDKLRLRFEKTGRAVYISHLDLMATMQRAFSRAGLELKYSEGFNPHPLISILLPLSLPEGIRVTEAYPAEQKSARLKWLDVTGRLEYDHGAPALEELQAFFSREELVIEKKTKRGLGQSDIRPAIDRIAFSADGADRILSARISAQEPTLNPDHLIQALRQPNPSSAH